MAAVPHLSKHSTMYCMITVSYVVHYVIEVYYSKLNLQDFLKVFLEKHARILQLQKLTMHARFVQDKFSCKKIMNKNPESHNMSCKNDKTRILMHFAREWTFLLHIVQGLQENFKISLFLAEQDL